MPAADNPTAERTSRSLGSTRRAVELGLTQGAQPSSNNWVREGGGR